MLQKLVYVNILDKMNNNYKKFMQKGGFARYAAGGPKKTKKYQSAGVVSPYSQNVMPQGVLPSQHIAFSEGANQFTQMYQNELDEATANLENFEPTAEQLGVVDPNQNPVGTQFAEHMSPSNLEKLGIIDPDSDFTDVIAGEHPSLRDSRVGQFFQKTFKGKGDDIASDIASNISDTPFSDNLPSILGSEGSNTYGFNMSNVTGTGPGTSPTFNMNMINPTSPSIAPPPPVPSGPIPGVHPGVDLIGQGTPSMPTLDPIKLTKLPTSSPSDLSLMPPSQIPPPVSGVNLTQTAGIGTAASIGGELIKMASDDQDPTTLNVGETAGTLIGAGGRGAGMAATLGMLAPALAVPGIGWIGAGVGALWGGISALRKKRKAEKEEKKQKKVLETKQNIAASRRGDIQMLTDSYSGFDYGKNLQLGGTPYRY